MGNYIRQRPATSKINPTSLNMICMNTKGKWRLRLPRFCDNTQPRPQNKKLLNALKLKKSQDAQFPDVSQRSLYSKLMFENSSKILCIWVDFLSKNNVGCQSNQFAIAATKQEGMKKSQILVLEIRKEIVSKIGKTKKQEKLHPMLEICLVESLANRTFFFAFWSIFVLNLALLNVN